MWLLSPGISLFATHWANTAHFAHVSLGFVTFERKKMVCFTAILLILCVITRNLHGGGHSSSG